MKNKYYTPSIEEFHVGFIFEAYNDFDWFFREDQNGWYEEYFDPRMGGAVRDLCAFGSLHKGIDEGKIRVKYLDRNDVDEVINSDKKVTLEVPKESCYAIQSGDYIFLLKEDKDPLRERNFSIANLKQDGAVKTYIHFRIKNKSELRKIMQMLNIKQENNAKN